MRVFFFQITQHAMTKMSSCFPVSEFFAQTTAPGGAQGPAAWMQFLPLVFLFGAMYFFMIAPQRKKQKEHEKMLGALQSGDEIVTTGGIFATITNVKEDRFVVRIADNTKCVIGKSFVQPMLKSQAAAAGKK